MLFSENINAHVFLDFLEMIVVMDQFASQTIQIHVKMEEFAGKLNIKLL